MTFKYKGTTLHRLVEEAITIKEAEKKVAQMGLVNVKLVPVSNIYEPILSEFSYADLIFIHKLADVAKYVRDKKDITRALVILRTMAYSRNYPKILGGDEMPLKKDAFDLIYIFNNIKGEKNEL